MITKTELTDLQLHSKFSASLPMKIKNIVNRELNAGVYLDGFEEVVFTENLGLYESKELLEVILNTNPEARIDLDKLSSVIDKELPQSACTKVDWIVEKDDSFIMTDSLRVAKFQGTEVLWRTPRISFDGIILEAIKQNKVFGLCWLLSRSHRPDVPFTIDLNNGSIISGEIIKD